MKHVILIAVLASACVPTGSSGPPQAAWGSSGAQPVAAGPAGGASCRDTLACYQQCQLTEACLQSCDQQSAASTQSHAVIACMSQNGCTDTACVSEKCSTEVSACGDLAVANTTAATTAPSTTTTTAGSADLSDVSYQAPAGWTESTTAGTPMYDFSRENQAGEPFYGTQWGRIAISPPIAASGDLGQVFAAEWQAMIVDSGFKTTFVPAPMRRRLANGDALIFDGSRMEWPQGGTTTIVNLYLVVAGDRAVPVLGLFNDDFLGKADTLEPVVLAFLESVAIKGEQSSTAALWSADEIAGAWSTQAVTIGTYVTSSGGYAGDATTATYDSYDLAADGRFKENFVGYHGGSAMQINDKGTWSVEDGTLILRGKSSTTKRAIFAIGQTPGGNTGILLASQYDGFAPVDVLNPRAFGNGDWYGKVTK